MGAKCKINILKRIKQYVAYKNPNQEIDEIRNFWHSLMAHLTCVIKFPLGKLRTLPLLSFGIRINFERTYTGKLPLYCSPSHKIKMH